MRIRLSKYSSLHILKAGKLRTRKVGNIYHVMEERIIPPNHYIKGILGVPGIYYNLLEIKGFIFHKSLFIEINDDQPDEVELIKEREQVF